ncbi:MAG: hypothetical protein ACM3PR_15295 [Bacteroidales bacterium]
MEKRLKILSNLTVFILYCFTLSIYGGTAVTSASHFSKATAQENFASAILSNDANHAEQAENSINVCKNIPRTSLKNSFNQYSFSSIAGIGAINNLYAFSFYIFYSKNLCIRFSKTDIIFPFHNFW